MDNELTRFKPGAEWNGNRAGRPKGRVSLTTLIRRALDGSRLGAEHTPDGRTVAEWLVDNMISHAMKGNAACMKEIMDRVEGKMPDPEPPAPAINMEMIARRLREKRDQRRARERLQDPIGRDVLGNPVEP
jgi:Family of unknown function (DUF5681)